MSKFIIKFGTWYRSQCKGPNRVIIRDISYDSINDKTLEAMAREALELDPKNNSDYSFTNIISVKQIKKYEN